MRWPGSGLGAAYLADGLVVRIYAIPVRCPEIWVGIDAK